MLKVKRNINLLIFIACKNNNLISSFLNSRLVRQFINNIFNSYTKGTPDFFFNKVYKINHLHTICILNYDFCNEVPWKLILFRSSL